MCEPVSVTQLILAGAAAIGTAAQIQAQNKQARAMEQAARAEAARQRAALEMQRQQIRQSIDLEIFERQRQALRERSRIAVAAGEAGVAGASPARLIAQSLFDASFDTGIHAANREATLMQTRLQEDAILVERDSRIRQARSQYTNPFLSGLMIAGSAAQGYYSAPRIY